MFRVELRTAEDRGITEELAERIVETQVREASMVSALRFTGLTAGALAQLAELRAERDIYVSLLSSI